MRHFHGAAKFHLYLKIWEGDKHFKGKKFFYDGKKYKVENSLGKKKDC